MAIYSADTPRNQGAFRVREHRGQLRRLATNLYTDDFDRPAEEIVGENLLAIAAALLPEWHLSHSSAATRAPVDGLLFMSGPSKAARALELPGVRIVRFAQLPAPEYDLIPTPTEVVRAVGRDPEPLTLKVSTPLQAVFECLSTSRRYPQKNLPDVSIASMIERLSASDRERAERFAVRNGLRREYLRYRELSFEAAAAARMTLAEPDRAEIYFYGWRIGALTYLGAGEYRFEYDPEWSTPLSRELPREGGRISYEGRRMPAFFENCLPEGWTEAVVLASNKLSREDLFGLFSTTRKYLSNMTLRPLPIPESELVYDAHDVRLARLERDEHGIVHLEERIGAEPADLALWRRTRSAGLVRLSGIQAKLPVSLGREPRGVVVRLGDLHNACTHILKIPSVEFPGLVENEWATMELARRIGVPTCAVAMVEFQPGSVYADRSLIVERYDIPDRDTLERDTSEAPLHLQEDACSLLLLRREAKYDTSLERIGDALLAAGIAAEDMRTFLHLVIYSWVIGNGDLHAKNVSVLRRFRTGRPGEPPVLEGIELAPAYDLVNTSVHLPNDEFALPVDGKRSNLRLRSFVELGSRWGMARDEVRGSAEGIVESVQENLDDVLAGSGLADDLRERYRDVVLTNAASLGL